MFLARAEHARVQLLLGSEQGGSRKAEEESRVQWGPTDSFLVGLFGVELLLQAKCDSRAFKQIELRCLLVALFCLALAVLTGWLGTLLFLPVYVLLEKGALKSKASVRAKNFDKDYTAFLLSIASGVKTGLDPLVALVTARHLFQEKSEMSLEIEQFQHQLEHGASEEQAVTRFGESIAHPDLRLFRTAFVLARKEGSSLSECLQRLARVTRQRQSFRRKIASALAMQKLSALGIGGCAVVISIIQASGNPEAIQVALNHPMGIKLLSTGGLLIGAGLLWMVKLSQARLL